LVPPPAEMTGGWIPLGLARGTIVSALPLKVIMLSMTRSSTTGSAWMLRIMSVIASLSSLTSPDIEADTSTMR
jgi:hypothetical protein